MSINAKIAAISSSSDDSIRRFYSAAFLRLPIPEMIPLGIGELLMLFLYVNLTAGLMLVLRWTSTQPLGPCTGSGASEEEAVTSRPSEDPTAARPARRTVIALTSAPLIFAVLCVWCVSHVQTPEAGDADDSVPFDVELWVLSLSLMCTMAGLVLVMLKRTAFLVPRSCGVHDGRLLLVLSCAGLIHLLGPQNGASSVGTAPAGLGFLLFLLFVGSLLLVSFGTATNLRRILPSFNLRLGRIEGEAATAGSTEVACGIVHPPRRSSQLAVAFVAFSSGGLVHLLVSHIGNVSESTPSVLKLLVFVLYLSLMLSTVMMIFPRISA